MLNETLQIVVLLKHTMHRFREVLDDALRPYGITAAQLQVLAMLGREPGISGAKLARICMVTPQTTQALIAAGEANGWIRREKHPENERILQATLTAKGRAILSRSREAVAAVHSQMLRDFSRGEVDALEALLSRCVRNLENGAVQRGQDIR